MTQDQDDAVQSYVQWRFGNCPSCHRCSNQVNVRWEPGGPGNGHLWETWLFCDTHKIRWYGGCDLWQFQEAPLLTGDEELQFLVAYTQIANHEIWLAEHHLDGLPPEEVGKYRRITLRGQQD
jgi:hypothetical protein